MKTLITTQDIENLLIASGRFLLESLLKDLSPLLLLL